MVISHSYVNVYQSVTWAPPDGWLLGWFLIHPEWWSEKKGMGLYQHHKMAGSCKICSVIHHKNTIYPPVKQHNIYGKWIECVADLTIKLGIFHSSVKLPECIPHIPIKSPIKSPLPIGSMYGIYILTLGVYWWDPCYHIYHTWILWVSGNMWKIIFQTPTKWLFIVDLPIQNGDVP